MPTPTATGASNVFTPSHSFIEDLFSRPPLRDLPFHGTLESATKIIVLAAVFAALNAALQSLIRRTGARVAASHGLGTAPARAGRVRTLTSIGESTVSYVLLFAFGVGALGVLGVNVLAFVGTAGVAGLAVGFGAQKLVKDVITGFFLLLEDQYGVGEFVTIGAVSGTVEELGMRATRLRDDDGRLFILSNGDISLVCNHSRGAIAQSFEIGIAAAADVDAAIRVINTALAPVSESLALTQPATVAGVSATDGAKTTLKVLYRVSIAQGSRRPVEIALQLREAVRVALVRAGVTLA